MATYVKDKYQYKITIHGNETRVKEGVKSGLVVNSRPDPVKRGLLPNNESHSRRWSGHHRTTQSPFRRQTNDEG